MKISGEIMTQKYTSKYQNIEAVQLTDKNIDKVYNFIHAKKWNITRGVSDSGRVLIIHTLRKELECFVGDYMVIIPPKGAFLGEDIYPLPATIFEAIYQKNESNQIHNNNCSCGNNSILPV